MPLPKRPKLGEPIPNADIPNVPEQYTVKAPYWDAVVEGNLAVTAEGALELSTGVGNGNPDVQVQGPYWNMALGDGLAVNAKGEMFAAVPQFPPYYCNTDVYTATVTDFTDAWRDCSFTSFPSTVDTSSGTNFSYCWYGCGNLASFPALDFSAGEDFTLSWAYCANLTSFPELDVSSGTNFNACWAACYGLTSFPLLDTSSGTVFQTSWYQCTGLTSFPLLNVSSGTSFNGAWQNCTSLTSFPLLDVSSGTSFYNAWSSCTSLTSFPLLDVSSGTNFYYAWNNCTSLTSFPLLDVSSGTDFYGSWFGCTSLTSFPLLDVSSGNTFSSAWASCTSLTSFPALDFSQGTYFNSAWYNCSSLVTFPAGVFDTCTATNFNNAWTNCALSQQSVDNILVSLDTAGQENGIVNIDGGTSSPPSLTGWNAVASLEGKGWTVMVNYPLSDNLLPYPSQFEFWSCSPGVITTNQITAPDGTSTADKWTETVYPDGEQRVTFYILPPLPQVSGKTCIASVYVKRFGVHNRNVQISIDDYMVVQFDLDNPSASTHSDDPGCYTFNSLSVTTLSDGWYKCSVTFYTAGTCRYNPYYHLRLLDSSLRSDYVGDGVSGLYIWNASWRYYLT